MTLPNRLSALLPDPADWIETALPEPRVAEVMTMTLAGAVTPRFVWPVGACDCSADNRDDAQAAALLQSDVMVTVTGDPVAPSNTTTKSSAVASTPDASTAPPEAVAPSTPSALGPLPA